jgi:hypothetical protein
MHYQSTYAKAIASHGVAAHGGSEKDDHAIAHAIGFLNFFMCLLCIALMIVIYRKVNTSVPESSNVSSGNASAISATLVQSSPLAYTSDVNVDYASDVRAEAKKIAEAMATAPGDYIDVGASSKAIIRELGSLPTAAMLAVANIILSEEYSQDLEELKFLISETLTRKV